MFLFECILCRFIDENIMEIDIYNQFICSLYMSPLFWLLVLMNRMRIRFDWFLISLGGFLFWSINILLLLVCISKDAISPKTNHYFFILFVLSSINVKRVERVHNIIFYWNLFWYIPPYWPQWIELNISSTMYKV